VTVMVYGTLTAGTVVAPPASRPRLQRRRQQIFPFSELEERRPRLLWHELDKAVPRQRNVLLHGAQRHAKVLPGGRRQCVRREVRAQAVWWKVVCSVAQVACAVAVGAVGGRHPPPYG